MRKSVVPIVVTVISGWILGFAVPGSAAVAADGGSVYYVDPAGGDDARRGDSVAGAWRTLEKVNEFRFAPGDTVLFRRGSVWHGGLSLTADGTAEQPIVVGSYGTGAAPVFTAAEN